MTTNDPTRRTFTRTVLVTLSAAALLAACSSDSDSAATTQDSSGSIEVTQVWARTSPMVVTAAAVYMTISNPGDADDALVSASVDPSVAGKVELHETIAVGAEDATTMTTESGMPPTETSGESTEASMPGTELMKMQPVDRIVVPTGETVALEPGGYHIMLLDLVDPLEVGASVQLTLVFEKGGEKIVTADVRDIAP